MRDYIEDFLGLQKLTKRKEQELKEIKERKECAAKLLLEQMAVEGLERVTAEGVTLYPRNMLSVTVQDKENIEALLESHGLEHCIGVRPATLKSAVTEMIGTERELSAVPEDLKAALKITEFTRLGMRTS